MDKKIRVTSLFSGIGAWEKALDNLGIEYELVNYCEFDKWASNAYSAIHNEDEKKNLGDITKINPSELEDFDMLVYSPPCQAFSFAGKRQGFDDDRGVLFFDAFRVIKEKRPKIAFMENVKGLVGKKFKGEFKSMLEHLEDEGYNNYWQVLNAKNHGMPQNRERVFIISIRKDVDNGLFKFPEPFKSNLRLKHLLDDTVDEKYYINDERVEKLLKEVKDSKISKKYEEMKTDSSIGNCEMLSDAIPILTPERDKKRQQGRRYKEEGEPMFSITALDRHGVIVDEGKDDTNGIIQVNNPNHFSGRVYSTEGIAPTIPAGNRGGGKEPCKIICEERTDEGLRFFKDDACGTIRSIDAGGDKRVIEGKDMYIEKKYKDFYEKNGYLPMIFNPYNCQEIRDISPTITSACGSTTTSATVLIGEQGELELVFVGGIGEKDWAGDGKALSRNFPQGNRVYDSDGIACSQTAQGGGIGSYTGLYLTEEDEIIELKLYKCECGGYYFSENETVCPHCNKEGLSSPHLLTEKEFNIGKIDENTNKIIIETNLAGGMWDKVTQEIKRVYGVDGISPTITTMQGGHRQPKILKRKPSLRIRKLIPCECFRLMGFTDSDYLRAKKSLMDTFYNGNDRTDSKMYKMAGNSIVVNVIEEIYKMIDWTII